MPTSTVVRGLAIVGVALIGSALMAAGGVWVWLQFDTPAPVQQLLDDDATIDLAACDGSAHRRPENRRCCSSARRH